MKKTVEDMIGQARDMVEDIAGGDINIGEVQSHAQKAVDLLNKAESQLPEEIESAKEEGAEEQKAADEE